MLLIHGGGWESLSKERMAGLARWLVRTESLEVWCPNYRLLPNSEWPTPLEDCTNAARFVLHHTARSSLIIAGVSAGGHLALLTGHTLPASQVHGILSIAGPATLKPIGNPLPPLFSRAKLSYLFGAVIKSENETAKASPYMLLQGGPPLALIHSINDRLVPTIHSLLMFRRYQQQRSRCQIILFNGSDIYHGTWAKKPQGSTPIPSVPFRRVLPKAIHFLIDNTNIPI